MDFKNITTDSQGSGEPAPPGTTVITDKKLNPMMQNVAKSPMASPASPGMLQAKKKLRAFSIQKKAVIPTPITVPKPMTSGTTTVLIGKLSGVKVTPKPEPDPDVKKPPKPPKPGNSRRRFEENYTEIQKKNVAEIEDMKRKMELVELGIPLGLICPTSSSVQAMPTKAMPPIKSFLDPAKVDELIREAKKAKAEGKDFKFELSKFLPDYDNPFQRKKDKDEEGQDDKKDGNSKDHVRKDSRWKSDRYEFKRHNDHRKKDEKIKYKDRSKDRDKKERSRDEREKKEDPKKEEKPKVRSDKDVKETDVNLNDYLVCDSWSLDTEEKTNSSSPKVIDKVAKSTALIPLPDDKPKDDKVIEVHEKPSESKEVGEKYVAETMNVPTKVEKLKPVLDSFKYELDSNEDEALDIFDEDTELDKFSNPTIKKNKPFESPLSLKLYDYDQEPTTADDENFLESVINEIKQEDMSDISQDKGLVEYDMSPSKDDEDIAQPSRESVTPELDDRMRDLRSQQSSYSDDYRSSESGYKSRESGYKSERSERSDSFRLSVEKELDEALERKMSKSTVESLETWSFILKICQPLLFRHDRNKCYKETHSMPKLWFTENPRRCACVKDRAVVYSELETCKMPLVDRVYGVDQIAEEPLSSSQQWYPRLSTWLSAASFASEWETDERLSGRTDTPRSEEIYLDREYQRFMQAVWPEASESKPETPNTTPVKETRKKKKADDGEDKRKVKKMKLSSEGWSQESEVEEDVEKSKKVKDKERRKRKLSGAAEPGDEIGRKRKKMAKKKGNKKTKTKEAKRRRLGKKYLRKLKEKTKKKKKLAKEKSDAESDDDKEKKKEKKVKKKKQLKLKKAQKKKKARTKSTSSSSSSSESSSESSSDNRKKKIEKKKKKKEKKRKQSSDSTQSEELFDVNILNNIKTERETDDEKRMEFSPRRQGERPREIINVKELQNDFVGNNIHIKQEKEEVKEKEVPPAGETAPTPAKGKTEDKVEFKEPEPQPPPEPPRTPQPRNTPQPETVDTPHIEDNSQCSSQESLSSKEQYEKDDSHLRPSSQNSNYSFNDVMASHAYQKGDEIVGQGYQKGEDTASHAYQKGDEMVSHAYQKCGEVDTLAYQKGGEMDTLAYQKGNEMSSHAYQKGEEMPSHAYQKGDEMVSHAYQKGDEMASHAYQKGEEIARLGYEKDPHMVDEAYQKDEEYQAADYEMYEQMAMAYQSDVASKQNSSDVDFTLDVSFDSQRIETVVGRLGEIKCDWRAGDRPPHLRPMARPSRWGLKPGQVNIVLTGGDRYQPPAPPPAPSPVYKIESIANRSADNASMSYDEAYMDMYGASDRLQYGDCFSTQTASGSGPAGPSGPQKPDQKPTKDPRRSTLDDRIDLALKNSVLGEVAKEDKNEEEAPEKGILVSKSAPASAWKRVRFADGYAPGQDSDVEAPPKKKKKVRRYGCAWPCPATHPDHVPLWDALPPPPPPASPPPPPPPRPPPASLLTTLRRQPQPPFMTDAMLQQQMAHHHKFEEEGPPLRRPIPTTCRCGTPCAPASPPPPPPLRPPPASLLTTLRRQLQPPFMTDADTHHHKQQQMAHHHKFEPTSSMPFMPPEPPPGMINFH